MARFFIIFKNAAEVFWPKHTPSAADNVASAQGATLAHASGRLSHRFYYPEVRERFAASHTSFGGMCRNLWSVPKLIGQGRVATMSLWTRVTDNFRDQWRLILAHIGILLVCHAMVGGESSFGVFSADIVACDNPALSSPNRCRMYVLRGDVSPFLSPT